MFGPSARLAGTGIGVDRSIQVKAMLYSDGCEYGGTKHTLYGLYLSFKPIIENASHVVNMPFFVFAGGNKTKHNPQISLFVPA